MASETWFERIRALDVRLIAAIGAALLLTGGVMWVVPTTPASQSFTFDTYPTDVSNPQVIEFGKAVAGSLVDGSDMDFYRVNPREKSYRMEVHMANGSPDMIPALRVFDEKNLVQDRSVGSVMQPGANIEFSFNARSNTLYFVQVSSQRNTNGSYSLTINVQP
jgi:hypothetical protein